MAKIISNVCLLLLIFKILRKNIQLYTIQHVFPFVDVKLVITNKYTLFYKPIHY